MITTTVNGVTLTCKPENLAKFQTKLNKPPKGGTRISAEKRIFPKLPSDIVSTAEYVKAYLRLNTTAGLPRPEHAFEHYMLNSAPTTWPDGVDCIYEEVTE
jgi:hypothetical protein